MLFNKLTFIASSIIEANTHKDYISGAKKLSDFYREIIVQTYSDDNEALLKGGVALSSFGAAECVDDYLRTVYFIKGIYKALNKLSANFTDRRINILYAGCGPYATLILPLLSLFDKSRFNVILLDINEASIKSVQNIISVIGLQEYNLNLVLADAITYKKPEDFIIDLAISETMHYALTREPQVSIVKNITSQLAPHSVLIPQEINIDLVYSFFDYEPFLNNAVNEVKGRNELQPYPQRVFVDRLFTINKELFSNPNYESKIVSNFYELPDNFINNPDVCLLTELTIYEDIQLKTAESYITNPYCIANMYSLKGASLIQLNYDFAEIPKWSYNTKRLVDGN